MRGGKTSATDLNDLAIEIVDGYFATWSSQTNGTPCPDIDFSFNQPSADPLWESTQIGKVYFSKPALLPSGVGGSDAIVLICGNWDTATALISSNDI